VGANDTATDIGQRRREVFDLFIFVRDELLIRVVADSNHAQVKARDYRG
jgi:hypothetical protein